MSLFWTMSQFVYTAIASQCMHPREYLKYVVFLLILFSVELLETSKLSIKGYAEALTKGIYKLG